MCRDRRSSPGRPAWAMTVALSLVMSLVMVVAFLSSAVPVATAVAAAAAATADLEKKESRENLFVNPGFEEIVDGRPVGWLRYTPDGSAAGLQVSTAARTGNYAGLLDVGAALSQGTSSYARIEWYQRFEENGQGLAEPGATYRFSVYYRTEGDPKGRLVVQIPQHTHPYVELPPSEEWRYAELEFTWPDIGIWAAVGIWTWRATGDGKLWFDDVRLEKVGGEMKKEQGGSEAGPEKEPGPSVYYVAPDGNDRNPGTKELPWATPAHAAAQAKAGDTVIFKPGVYYGVLQPQHDGEEGAPITFRGEKRREAILVGSPGGGGSGYAVSIQGRRHIRLEGLTIRPEQKNGNWLYIKDSQYIVVDDLLMEEAAVGRPFVIDHGEQIRVQNCDIRKQGYGKAGGDTALVQYSKHIIFEGNAFSRGGHDLVLVYPDYTNEYVVFRGNVFHGAWTRPILIDGVKDVLFEGNIITNSYDGGRNAGSNQQFYAVQGIYRYNKIYGNWGVDGLNIEPYRDTLDFHHVRLYNNAFYDNAAPAVQVLVRTGYTNNIVDGIFSNNLFYGNDPYADNCQINFNGELTSDKSETGLRGLRFDHNAISGTIGYSSQRLSLELVQSPAWTSFRGSQFENNFEYTFPPEHRFDREPPAGSPLIDAGRVLTHTTAKGEGHILPVADAHYFYDGFGIVGEVGDLISVVSADSRQIARIVKVDKEKHLLYLDRSLTWDEGDAVGLPWVGAAPDIGVFERGLGLGGSIIAVTATPEVAFPGELVELRVEPGEGLRPEQVLWHLGDGSTAEGLVVRHAYSEPYDYPIRVEVLATSGQEKQVYRGTAYVVVQPAVWQAVAVALEAEEATEVAEVAGAGAVPRLAEVAGALAASKSPNPAILLRTTFDADDEEWFWRWKVYRPEPTDWKLVPEEGGEAGAYSMQVMLAGNKAIMPARVHPVGWMVADYPLVRLRYRIIPDTPVGLYIEAFPSVQGTRRIWVAMTDSARQSRGLPASANLMRLVADNEWHDLVFDIRPYVKRAYPEVTVLQALGFEAIGYPAPTRPMGYWFDDVIISALPQSSLASAPAPSALSAKSGRVIRVSDTARLLEAIEDAVAGDTILLADGTYTGDQVIVISGKQGTEEQPIIIAAENTGKAEIAGNLLFVIEKSRYLILRGLKFTTTGEPSSAGGVTGAVIIGASSSHIRVTGNHFALTEQPGLLRTKNWVRLQGQDIAHVRIDHNLFENKQQLGSFIVLHVSNNLEEDDMARHTLIDHNHFKDMATLGQNGGEAIRIGNTRYKSQIDSHTIIEHNLFERTDGERSEIISLKNSSNIIRYNTVLETEGAITLRYGDRNSVYGNYFLGNGKPGTGGVRIYGQDQKVYNNYFAGLTREAVTLGSGNADDVAALDETGYIRLNRVEVVHNTFVDNNTHLAYQHRPDTYPLEPMNTVIANNLFYNTRVYEPMFSRQSSVLFALPGVSWSGNLVHGPVLSLYGTEAAGEAGIIKVSDPALTSGLDKVYFPAENSPLVDAGGATFAYLDADIEGKPRDARPDVGCFEYSGRPLLIGPLTADKVGPYAPTALASAGTLSSAAVSSGSPASSEPAGVYITAMEVIEGESLNPSPGAAKSTVKYQGPVVISIDGLAFGSTAGAGSLTVKAHIDGKEMYSGSGFPAVFTINHGELDEGEHQLVVTAESGALRDRRELSFEVENIIITNPSPADKLNQPVPLDVRLHLPTQAIKNIAITAGEQLLFSGRELPSDLQLDPAPFADGRHRLVVEVERADGGVSRRESSFTIARLWEIKDDLEPPLNWGAFGMLKRIKADVMSSGWQFAVDRPEDFSGDKERLVRTKATDEYLVWETPNLVKAEVTIFTRRADLVREALSLAFSADGHSYQESTWEIRSEGKTAAGWERLVLTADVASGTAGAISTPVSSINFFKLMVAGDRMPPADLQIGEVLLQGLN